MSSVYRKGVERSGISEAFLENEKFLRRYLRQFVPSYQDAEDVTQEAYVRAVVAEKKTDIEQPKAFLFQVARNVALTRLEKKSREINQCIDELSEPETGMVDASADDHAEALELLDTYCEAVAAMSPRCRDVFLLRKVYGYKHKEIAQQLGISLSSVEKYVRRGILACQDHLNRCNESQAQRYGDDELKNNRNRIVK